MSGSDSSFYSYDKEKLIQALDRFDAEITVEDVTDSTKSDNSRYIHTGFLQLLLECICTSFVKSEEHRELLLNEVCKRLSQSDLLNKSLLMKSSPSRKKLRKMFLDYMKQICEEVIPDAEIDLNAFSVFEEKDMGIESPQTYKNSFDELEIIGRGGFGVVCKARDKFTDTVYAVKKILFKYKNDSRYLRVVREAKNIAALNHPNVVHYNNAWTELSPDDCNLSCTDSGSGSSPDSYDTEKDTDVSAVKIKKKASHSSKRFSSRFAKRNNLHNSSIHSENCKEISSIESSSSVIFTNTAESTCCNVTWSSGSYCQSEDNVDNSSDESDDSWKLNFNLKSILYIQMEYCDCDLRVWLDKRARGNPLPFQMNVTEIFTNILNGVAHIHSKCIIHRDLKPQNIFYSESSNVLKIGDFGLATLTSCSIDNASSYSISNVHSANIGTLPYAAPEQIKGKSYDSKVDIYSLGIILIELLNTFSTLMEFSKIIDAVKKGNFPVEMKEMPKLMNIVTNLVSEDPEGRMSAKEILDILEENSKVPIEEREMILRKKEIILNEKEMALKQKEAALGEKAALDEKDKEIARLKALLNELQKKT